MTTSNQDTETPKSTQALPSAWRCLTGALISGGLTSAIYFLTASIATTFANKPLTSNSQTALKIAIAVRTLVVGVSTLATFIFGITTLGLLALAIQQLYRTKFGTLPPK